MLCDLDFDDWGSPNMLKGDTHGRYDEIVGLPPPLKNLGFLGSGGQGMAWLALDPSLNRRLVVKRFETGQSIGKDTLAGLEATFAAQAKVAAKTSVVPQIYGVERFEGAVWLFMEYVEGLSLQALQAQKKITLGDGHILFIVMDLINALSALEHSGLVHGDLAPGNILVNAQGHIRLIDFSNSAFSGTARPMTGAPGFVRLKKGRAKAAELLDDQYALGCLIYWLLAADFPVSIRDQNDQEVVLRPQQPEDCSPVANLLWESAATLVKCDKKSFAVLSKLAVRYRQQARLMPLEIRSALGAYAADNGCQNATSKVEDEYLSSSRIRSDRSVANSFKPVLARLGRGPTTYLRGSQPGPKRAALMGLTVLLVLAGYFYLTRVPPLTLDAVKVEANTVLPAGFSHDWLLKRLERIVEYQGLVVWEDRSLIAELHCDHYTCVLSLAHSAGGISHSHQQSFAASRRPQVWESAITDLGRAAAMR